MGWVVAAHQSADCRYWQEGYPAAEYERGLERLFRRLVRNGQPTRILDNLYHGWRVYPGLVTRLLRVWYTHWQAWGVPPGTLLWKVVGASVEWSEVAATPRLFVNGEAPQLPTALGPAHVLRWRHRVGVDGRADMAVPFWELVKQRAPVPAGDYGHYMWVGAGTLSYWV